MKHWENPFGKEKPKVVDGELHIIKDRCKGCSFCIEFCPNGVLELSTEFNIKGYHPPVVVNIHNCSFDGLCESICPDSAIFVVRYKEKTNEEK
ncbi:MAG: ferredoxin family protein [Candidatus Cloacimonetes bacterium]|nr:ferredoxin family protein [Candidatus Cloacimonadota bacterium]